MEAGIDPEFAFYLVAIANVAGAFGRVFAGYLGDKFGRHFAETKYLPTELPAPGAINMLVPFTLVFGTMTLVWPFVDSEAGYIIVSIIYG